MNSAELQQLRAKSSDSVIYRSLYSSDPAFRATVDKYLPHKDSLSPIARVKFDSAMLNKHYLGRFNDAPQPSESKAGQMYNVGVQRQKVAKNLQQQQAGQGLMGYVGETIGNIPGSAARYATGIWDAITNPVQTAKTIGKLGIGAGINAAESVTGNEEMFNNPIGSEDVASQFGKYITDRYGSLDAAAETLKTDPVGFLSDISTVVTGVGGVISGGAKLASTGARIATAGSEAVALGSTAARVGQIAGQVGNVGKTIARAGFKAEPAVIAGRTALGAAKIAKGALGFGVKQLTGLEGGTIKFISQHADDFDAGKAPSVMKEGIESTFQKKIQQFEGAMKGDLPQYKALRNTPNDIVMARNPLVSALEGKGLTVTENVGKDGVTSYRIGKSINSRVPLTSVEMAKLEDVLNLTVGRKIINTDQFFNIRGELTELSRFDRTGTATNNLNDLARELRKEWNKTGRPQIKGLDALDTRFSGVAGELEDLATGFAKMEDGRMVLTETGYKKLLNLTNRGNEKALAQVKKYIPDIEEQVKALRAVEDVIKAGEQKVGTYSRAIIGAGGGAMVGGPLGAIAGLLLSSPTVTIPIIKAYGRLMAIPKNIINAILSKLKSGEKLSVSEGKVMGDALKHFDDVNTAFRESREQISPRVVGTEARSQAGSAKSRSILPETPSSVK